MLKLRIISTLNFFDLQDTPLTLLELHFFLLADIARIKERMGEGWEVKPLPEDAGLSGQKVPLDRVLLCLETECQGLVEETKGFYSLAGRKHLAKQRLENYAFGLGREKLVRRYAKFLRYLPFVRGAALGGSQALGLQKESSDIDLLIITDPQFMWLARTFATIYFQLLGRRRHGDKVANRFCLNHYLSRPKQVDRERNLYKAMEYARLRPLVCGRTINEFRNNNTAWINWFLPNAGFNAGNSAEQEFKLRLFLEKIFRNSFGRWLEGKLKTWQMARIKQEEFIFVTGDELSFHPESRHAGLLEKFFASAGENC
ncbi:MAG: nucleotidyltransferase domain-containing protein [Patescibacteria group bacterium]|nr:nucleotidyltransferase domain-containing protein [Patescibacteria group bacterium]